MHSSDRRFGRPEERDPGVAQIRKVRPRKRDAGSLAVGHHQELRAAEGDVGADDSAADPYGHAACERRTTAVQRSGRGSHACRRVRPGQSRRRA